MNGLQLYNDDGLRQYPTLGRQDAFFERRRRRAARRAYVLRYVYRLPHFHRLQNSTAVHVEAKLIAQRMWA